MIQSRRRRPKRSTLLQRSDHLEGVGALVLVCVIHVFHQHTRVTKPKQEYEKFARFTDSLLARSSKLTDLAQQLESGLAEAKKTQDSPEGKRVNKLGTKLHYV